MAGSYRRIDYRVRPAKSIERKMLAESFRKLSEFGAVSGYRYVGFGSVYFSDFSLFHRLLGIETMVSIENASDRIVQDRFKLNIPYGNIEVKFGHSNVVLQTLEWSQRTIAWLDYDGVMNDRCLEDLSYFAKMCEKGSVLLVSVNAGNLEDVPLIDDSGDEVENASVLDRLKKTVGKFSIPPDIKSSNLAGWGVGDAYRRIATGVIEDSLRLRNSALASGARLKYKQIFHFRYADGVRMVTFGWVFYDESQEHIVAKCAFDQLDFVRFSSDAYVIDPPNLTYVEMRQIDAGRRRPMVAMPISEKDVAKYEATYRYFPKFIEAEIS